MCSILDIDLVECRLVLSRNPNVLPPPPCSPAPSSRPVTRSRTVERNKRKSAAASLVIEEVGLRPGASVVGLVEHKTQYYLVLSCSTLSGCKLAYGLMNTVSGREGGRGVVLEVSPIICEWEGCSLTIRSVYTVTLIQT